MDPFVLLLIALLVVVGSIIWLRLPAFISLIAAALIVGLLTPDSALEAVAQARGMQAGELVKQGIGGRLTTAFGNTCGKIGILIAMAAVIGQCLARSGAADRIIRAALNLLGMKRVPAALLLSGFTLGIPVFFDTVFYLMFPLARALALRNTGKYALYLLAIIAGAAMAHSLVPPTPGPLFVAGELGVGIGEMIIGGILVGLFAAAAGYAYAWWSHRRWPVPLRSTAESSLEDLQARQQHKDEALPGLAFSLLPVLLPVLLIAGQTTLRTLWGTQSRTGLQAWVYDSLMLLGNSTIALSLAAGLALLLLYRQVPDKKALRINVQEALASAGMIILITGAGGAFGSMLQQSGVGLRIQELASGLQMGVLPLAFLITALVRFAQGSATVAMITAVGIMAAMASPGSLGFHPLYLALAIGCGSKPLPWMNDSGFWIICKMSGMTETETLRHHTVMMSIMGVAGLLVTMLLAVVFPLV